MRITFDMETPPGASCEDAAAAVEEIVAAGRAAVASSRPASAAAAWFGPVAASPSVRLAVVAMDSDRVAVVSLVRRDVVRLLGLADAFRAVVGASPARMSWPDDDDAPRWFPAVAVPAAAGRDWFDVLGDGPPSDSELPSDCWLVHVIDVGDGDDDLAFAWSAYVGDGDDDPWVETNCVPESRLRSLLSGRL